MSSLETASSSASSTKSSYEYTILPDDQESPQFPSPPSGIIIHLGKFVTDDWEEEIECKECDTKFSFMESELIVTFVQRSSRNGLFTVNCPADTCQTPNCVSVPPIVCGRFKAQIKNAVTIYERSHRHKLRRSRHRLTRAAFDNMKMLAVFLMIVIFSALVGGSVLYVFSNK